jgi:hypothetical protein
MKRVLLVVLSGLIPAASFAAVETQATMTVTLAAAPAMQVFPGGPITLTATASIQPRPVSKLDPLEHVRYTVTAQRTWPCPDTITIASNVSTKTVTWNPQKAGIYDISVRAARGSESKGLTLPSATGSLPNYVVRPGSVGESVVTDFNPPSLAWMPQSARPTAPVQLTMGVSMKNPPEGRWYRYSYRCYGCQPESGAKDNQPASTSFQMTLPNPGQYAFSILVEKVRQSDCVWEQSNGGQYNYTVRAP